MTSKQNKGASGSDGEISSSAPPESDAQERTSNSYPIREQSEQPTGQVRAPDADDADNDHSAPSHMAGDDQRSSEIELLKRLVSATTELTTCIKQIQGEMSKHSNEQHVQPPFRQRPVESHNNEDNIAATKPILSPKNTGHSAVEHFIPLLHGEPNSWTVKLLENKRFSMSDEQIENLIIAWGKALDSILNDEPIKSQRSPQAIDVILELHGLLEKLYDRLETNVTRTDQNVLSVSL